jgi:hypothetical protein
MMSQTLTWFTNYNMDFDLGNLPKLNEYIDKLSNKTDEKNMENKINQIEKDYNDKLKEVSALCANPNLVEEIKQKSCLLILQKELEIVKLLTKYTLQNKNLDYEFFVACLNILLNLSETLRIKLDQKEVLHEKQKSDKPIDVNTISRCSYKFCSYQENCSYNYNSKTKNLCYQDHYVHNMVSADLKILIDYIKQRYEKTNIVLHNKEILKTINTLSFVIGHMEHELRAKCMYLPENEWESCHVVKNK